MLTIVRTLAACAVAVLCLAPPSPAQAAEVFPELILERFRQAGLPVDEAQIYDETTDPNSLLNRPGQYFAKATWHDARIPGHPELDADRGGTMELFRTPAELARRRDYLAGLMESIPWMLAYQYERGPVVMRVSRMLTPSQAAEYDRVLGDLVNSP